MAYIRPTTGVEQIIEKFGKEVVRLAIKAFLIDSNMDAEKFRQPLKKMGLVKTNRSQLYFYISNFEWSTYYEITFQNGHGTFARFQIQKAELNDLIKRSIEE